MGENKVVRPESLTIEEYLRSMIPNATFDDAFIRSILIDSEIADGALVCELSERQKDISKAHLYSRMALNPSLSQKITDKDGEWEHSEGSEQWSEKQLKRFLILARNLFHKWGITDSIAESVVSTWRVKGSGHHAIRRYERNV